MASTYIVSRAFVRREDETHLEAMLESLDLVHGLVRCPHATRAFAVVAGSGGAHGVVNVGAGRGVKGDHRAVTLPRDLDVDMDTGETKDVSFD